MDPIGQAEVEVDSVVYNTVLAACVSAEQLDQASVWEFQEVQFFFVLHVLFFLPFLWVFLNSNSFAPFFFAPSFF